MKAIRICEFGEPSVLKLINNLAIPKPSDNEILIEVKYAGVNPVDSYRRSGKFNNLPELPWIPGSDCSGIVLESGSNAQKKFSTGQRVFTTHTSTGAYSSHTVAQVNHVHALPETLSFQQGACLGIPYFTAYVALFTRGKAEAGEMVLIHGASGGVGIACIQLAKAYNLKIIGTAGTTEGLEMIKNLGADHVFNHREENYQEKIEKEFGGKINIIIEMLANKNLATDCELAAANGRIMVVGCRGNIDFNPRLTMAKSLDIRGVSLFSTTSEQWEDISEKMSKLLAEDSIKPIVSKEYDLVDAPEAHHDVIFSSATMGKLVLKI